MLKIMIEEIKNLRVQIDCLSQLVKELKPLGEFDKNNQVHQIRNPKYNSDEILKCYDSLILAKAWLGKVLQELGEETPYKNDGNRKTVEDIEPTADIAEFKIVHYDKEKHSNIKGIEAHIFNSFNHIERVDWLRQEINKIVEVTDPYRNYENNLIWNNMSSKGMAYLFNTNRHLSEAGFWLGWELSRIKNKSNEK